MFVYLESIVIVNYKYAVVACSAEVGEGNIFAKEVHGINGIMKFFLHDCQVTECYL